MITTTVFVPLMAAAIGLLLVGSLSKNEDYSTLLLGGLGVFITVVGVFLLVSPLQFQSGITEIVTTNSSTNSTTALSSYEYTNVSSLLNTALALTLTIIGIFSSWVANLQRKDKENLAQDDGLGGFD